MKNKKNQLGIYFIFLHVFVIVIIVIILNKQANKIDQFEICMNSNSIIKNSN